VVNVSLQKKRTVYHLSGVIYTYCSLQKEMAKEKELENEKILALYMYSVFRNAESNRI
jgi:septum formation inhibitor-activating ATPase MinD